MGQICSGDHEHQQVWGSNKFGPRSIQKATWPEPMCAEILRAIVDEQSHRSCMVAFPAEMENVTAEELGPLDDPELDETPAIGSRLSEKAEKEQELLDSLKFDGFPQDEQARREAWLKLPRTVRASIRRLHTMLGHKPKAVMLQVMKGAGVESEIVEGAKFFRCDDCSEISVPSKAAIVKAPSLYAFNYEVIIDVFYTQDMDGVTFGYLSIVDNGTTFHVIALVCEGHGTPKSAKCYRKFQTYWVSWAGYPQIVTTDRGLHNRGAFARGLTANGTYLRQAALEAPEQIGRGERHGGIFKGLMKPVIKQHHVRGKEQMKQVAAVVAEEKNDGMRRNGFAPSQWVLAKFPRRPGSMAEEAEWGQLGVLAGQVDSATAFGQKSTMRLTAKKSFVKMDCGRRYAAAMLRAARPIAKNYSQGDWVMYRVSQGSDAPGTDWAGPARIIGEDGDNAWLQHNAVPILTATRLLRPATTAEMLACQVMAKNMTPRIDPMTIGAEQQDGYIDARLPEPEQAAVEEPAAPAATQEEEEAKEDSDSEPEQNTQAPPLEDREEELEQDVGREPKRLRRPDTAAASSSARQPGTEVSDLQSPLERHLERIGVDVDDPGRRLARTIADRHDPRDRSRSRERGETQNISSTTVSLAAFAADGNAETCGALDEFEEYQTFFAERVQRKESKAFLASKGKMHKKKNLEKRGKLLIYQKLDHAHQKLLDESRLKEWNNYLKLGAVKVISKEEAEQIVYSGDSEELPTQWIETDKNEFLRSESGKEVEPKMKSRLVARGDLSNIYGRSDSPTADKEAVFIVVSFASSRKLVIKCGDLDHGYFQGERLSKPLILKQPHGGLPDASIEKDARLLAFVPIYGTKDAGRGLWRRIRKILIKHGLMENYILGALYSYAREGVVLLLIGTHVDDLIWANEPELEPLMQKIMEELIFGKVEEMNFRFCGMEVNQEVDFTITLTCEQTSKKLFPIRLTQERSRQTCQPCTEEEKEDIMSVAGLLMWIARSCRPGIAYNVSTLQSASRKPIVSDIILANKVVKYVSETPKTGLTYKPCTFWPRVPGEANPMCMAAVSDASHGNEEVYLDEFATREAFRSQGAKLVFLADAGVAVNDAADVHLISFGSTVHPCSSQAHCQQRGSGQAGGPASRSSHVCGKSPQDCRSG